MSLEDCFKKWKVKIDSELEKELKRRYPEDIRNRFLQVIKEIEEDLNSDPSAIIRLLREPIVDRTLNLRRIRIGKYRAWFIVILEDCLVVFLGFGPREKFYNRYKKRGI
jgi:mRNA-degrading endonuclease RelE of RelBE toxin-antitoxin system